MHFTKSQIEEIAKRLAVITKRDSEFPDVVLPLDNTERVPLIQYLPIVQDYENRLLSLADLRSLVLADTDQTSIGCLLTVTCSTSGATIKINGEARSTYAAYYGEIVDVVISAEDYDSWYGAITMTQDHTLVIALSEKSEQVIPEATTCIVKITNNQGAQITINGSPVASGSINVFDKGSSIRVIVSGSGYETFDSGIVILNEDYVKDITLPEGGSDDPTENPYLRFSKTELTIPASGDADTTVSVESNVSWVITGEEVIPPSEEDPEEEAPAQQDEVAYQDVTLMVGQTYQFE